MNQLKIKPELHSCFKPNGRMIISGLVEFIMGGKVGFKKNQKNQIFSYYYLLM
jgi:hypothetical protein